MPFAKPLAFFVTALIVGPLLGSFITEPAAMTVTALILKRSFFDQNVSNRFKYVTLAVLFVNVSIGGVLTPFAAPPVLMVATQWNWGMGFMLTQLGWKATVATVLNTAMAATLLRQELSTVTLPKEGVATSKHIPIWLTSIHLLFLALVVLTAHNPVFFLGLFLFFLGIVFITQEYQDELKLRESLLVGFFLAGLVILGSLQGWWLQPLLTSLSEFPLFLGATILTAFVDNAALTYLGTQVPHLEEGLKYALVSGAVAGGGLTIIANAPNPAGFTILRSSFGPEGISPVTLFLYALFPTLIAMICLWALPGIG
jgi:predicted cation transporter